MSVAVVVVVVMIVRAEMGQSARDLHGGAAAQLVPLQDTQHTQSLSKNMKISCSLLRYSKKNEKRESSLFSC